MLKKSLLINMAIALLMASFFLVASDKGWLERLELASINFQFFARGPIPYNENINIIEIADGDIGSLGRWPWTRYWHAGLTTTLHRLGAKYTYFDILFAEPSDEKDDGLFELAIRQSKNVYLPFALESSSRQTGTIVLPLQRFNDNLKGSGAINIDPDIDGIYRRIPLILTRGNEQYPHIALRIALDYLGAHIKEITPRYILIATDKEEFKIPVVGKNKELLVNWCGKWEKTFHHYGYHDILNSYQTLREGKKPEIDLTEFKDGICLVGITAIGLYDIRATPIHPQYPGIGVLATAISNIIDKKFIHEAPAWLSILILYILALIPAFFIFGERPLREILDVAGIAVIYLIINFIFFRKGVQLPLFTHLLGLFTTHLAISAYNFIRIAVERQSFFKMSVTDGLTGIYNIRYFKMLLESEVNFARIDPHKKFSVIMGDIDHFKHFNDTYGHQIGDLVLKEVANIIKASVRSMDIVARYGGEEMIVLLRGASIKDALAVAEKIRNNMENYTIKDEDRSYKVTISLGVASFAANDTADGLIKRADDGLYRSKESGRNRVSTIETEKVS